MSFSSLHTLSRRTSTSSAPQHELPNECRKTLKRLPEKQRKPSEWIRHFTVTEQSLQDMVQHAVQREMSKLKPAPRKTSNCRRNNTSTSRNRQSQGNSSPKDKGTSQNRRSRSKQRKQSPRRPRVSFFDSRSPASRRQQSKNGRGRGNGLVK